MHLRTLLLACVPLLTAGTLGAQEPIRFARTPDISPDGKTVAFSYLGDVWTVESVGGVARPVTMHEAHDINPVFSPDGRQIAFSSNRHGSYDVFVVSAQGGKPRRLTYDSAADMVCGWSPDGQHVLFASARSNDFPPNYELYSVPVAGGSERRLGIPESKEGIYSPKGDAIAFTRGQGTWYRKGYRGSSNDDIWVSAADGSGGRRLTDFNGQDTSPMWSADGKRLFYVSEVGGGPANIVSQEISPNPAGPLAAGKPVPLTHHTEDSVRKARVSGNGEWIVYECGADLWIASTRGGTPRKLAIEVHADDKTNTERLTTFTSGATEFSPSPDEKHVAFVVHGTLFLAPLSTEGRGKATQLTDGSAFDHGATWSPDGKKIIFASDRTGHEELYLLEPDDAEHPELTAAHKFKVKQLTHTPDAEIGASFSPDGKRVAFLRAGKLWTMNPDGTDEKVVVADVQVDDYDWSPDGKWFVYARTDGSFASELYIVPAAGGASRNVTRYATANGDVTWSQTNGKIAFVSQRHGAPSMHVLALQKPAVAGASSPSGEIDWDDIHLRVTQAAPLAAESGAISADGSKVAFRATNNTPTGPTSDLWVAASGGGELSRVTTGNLRPTQIRWSKKLSSVIYFLDRGGSIRTARAGGGLSFSLPGSSAEPGEVKFTAKLMVRRDEEFREMFDQSWRALRDNFYDPKFHGSDWEAVRAKYRPLVAHVASKEDLYALISLMLGELNASHLGITGPGAVPEELTADLGLLFDESYRGPGLKVAEVLKRGPADKRGLALKPGDVILSLDRTEITEKTNLSRLLNGKAGETLVAQVLSAPGADPKDPMNRRKVELSAVGREKVAPLMYERWVERNAKRVEALSKGSLGYIHIPSMDDEGVERFVRALYSDNFDKDAIVLDVRYNGGGFTHDQVLNYLGGREHTFFRQRDGGEGLVLRSFDRKWTKPVVVLINGRSYSDAEIFPSAFRAMGLGKVVGQPTGGMVIGTAGIRLIDGSVFRVPRIGVYTASGVNMEREGVQPDVAVEANADQLAKGNDAQLDRAVEVVTKDVVAWKKARSGTAGKTAAAGGASAGLPAAPIPPTPPPPVTMPPAAPGAGGRN
jgi:tricorn protease